MIFPPLIPQIISMKLFRCDGLHYFYFPILSKYDTMLTFALSHILMKGKWEICRLLELLKILDLW